MLLLLAVHLFCLQLAAGLAALTLLVSRRSLGHGFYQLHLTVALAFGVFSLWGMGRPLELYLLDRAQIAPAALEWLAGLSTWATLAACGLLFAAAFLYGPQNRIASGLHLGGAAALVMLLLVETHYLGRALAWPAQPGAGSLLLLVNALLGGGGLALALLAMNVGHWYLVRPRLGMQHLVSISAVLFGALLFRGLFLVPSGLVTVPGGVNQASVATSFPFFEAGRLLVGYLAPAALGWMAFQTARIRSTQSATGLLYALLVLLLIGEAVGAFLTVAQGVPW